MDKFEFKIRVEELYKLIENGEFSEAQDMADAIEWDTVRDVRTLCMVSDIYKVNKRYRDARRILSYAYRISPKDKAIVYSLCDLCLMCDDIVAAIDLHNEYKVLAEGDPSVYILSYKVYVALDASSNERIEVLENFQNTCGSYKPKWMYELAYLYHKYGRETDCVTQCSMILSFFRSGKYVIKAIELKSQHVQLTSEEEMLYKELTTPQEEIIIPEVDVSTNSNIALEQELAGSVQSLYAEENNSEVQIDTALIEEAISDDSEISDTKVITNIEETRSESEEKVSASDENSSEVEEEYISESVPSSTESENSVTTDEAENSAYEESGETSSEDVAKVVSSEGIDDEISTEETENETSSEEETAKEEISSEPVEPKTTVIPVITKEMLESKPEETKIIPTKEIEAELEKNETAAENTVFYTSDIEKALGGSKIEQDFIKADGSVDFDGSFASDEDRRTELDELLTLEGDGQIGFVVQDDIAIEKQITGQMCIDDMLLKIADDRRAVEKSWDEKMDEEVDQQNKRLREIINQTKEPDIFEQIEARSTGKLPPLPTKLDSTSDETDSKEEIVLVDENGQPLTDEEIIFIDEKAENEEPTAEELFFDRSQYVQEENTESSAEAAEETSSSDTDAAFAYLDAFAENAERLDDISNAPTLEGDAAVIASAVLNGDTAEINALHVMEQMLAEEKAKEAESYIKQEEAKDNYDEPASEENSEESEEIPDEEISETSEENNDDGENDEESKAPETDEELNPFESVGDGDSEVEETHEEEPSHDGFTNKQWDRYESFVQTEVCREQIKDALTKISHEANTGNTIIGSVDEDSAISLGKFFIEEFADRNEISGKTVSVKASVMNSKTPASVFEALEGGALIITNADELRPETLRGISEALEVADRKIFVVFTVPHRLKHKFIMDNPDYLGSFTVSVDIEALDDDELVKLATEYAYNNEYSIDDMGNLALHTIISGRQTNSHSVTYKEVKSIVDKAISHSSKPSVKHLFDTILGKRFDSNDMIILREKDFK